MSDETYNGWPNRETWALMLHLWNDAGLLSWAEEFARDHVEGSGAVRPYALGEDIIEAIEVLWEEFEGAEWVRLMRSDVGSVWRINCYSVGWNLLDAFGLIGEGVTLAR